MFARELLGVLVGDEQALAEGIHERRALRAKGATCQRFTFYPLLAKARDISPLHGPQVRKRHTSGSRANYPHCPSLKRPRPRPLLYRRLRRAANEPPLGCASDSLGPPHQQTFRLRTTRPPALWRSPPLARQSAANPGPPETASPPKNDSLWKTCQPTHQTRQAVNADRSSGFVV